jgi:DNA-binding SARP family transcriptional activator
MECHTLPMQLLLLGRPRLITSGIPHALTGYGALTLAWLALASHDNARPSRVRLARNLWPDETEDQARKRLTNALYRLKKEFPDLEANLIADANAVRLQNVQVDALEFDRLLRNTDPNDRLAGLELYQRSVPGSWVTTNLEHKVSEWVETR